MGTISVQGIGKAYKKYTHKWGRIAEWFNFGSSQRHFLHWVIRHVTFVVNPGDAVGIIGLNGAGKSTLLKIIAGTTRPSEGAVTIYGRVAALLELGMGFHPDFTGRENVYMAGLLLGISNDQISKLMPEIEDFAEIGVYIDEPVRIYSSGMQVRLAFSVATAIRPDVLIIDEALSVGDTYFQHKSFERIRQFRDLGTTLLIVSHDRQSIMSLCDRAILLNEGGLAMEGDPDTVMDYYNALLADHQNQNVSQHALPDGKVQTVSGSQEVVIYSVSLLDEYGKPIELVRVGQKIQLKIQALCHANTSNLVAGFVVRDRLGQSVYGTNSYHLAVDSGCFSIGDKPIFLFEFPANFGEGSYSVTVALHEGSTHLLKNYEWKDRAVMFSVINTDKTTFVGQVWVPTSSRCDT